MNKKYSVEDVLKIVWKNILVIVVLAIVGAVGFGGLAQIKKTTTYSSQRNVVISHDLSDSNVEYKNSQLRADLNMIPTYSELMNDHKVMAKAHKLLSKKISKQYKTDNLKEIISENTKPDSLVINISATTSSPKASTEIVNAVSQAFKTELPRMQSDVGDIKLMSKAQVSSAKSSTSPSVKKYVVLGFALGALVGMIIAFAFTTWKKII